MNRLDDTVARYARHLPLGYRLAYDVERDRLTLHHGDYLYAWLTAEAVHRGGPNIVEEWLDASLRHVDPALYPRIVRPGASPPWTGPTRNARPIRSEHGPGPAISDIDDRVAAALASIIRDRMLPPEVEERVSALDLASIVNVTVAALAAADLLVD